MWMIYVAWAEIDVEVYALSLLLSTLQSNDDDGVCW
jgi:hypothetical protein